MKAKLLHDAGEILEGTEVEIASAAGTNDERSDKDGRTEHHRSAGLRGDRRRRAHGEGRHARPQAVAVTGSIPGIGAENSPVNAQLASARSY